MTPGVEVRIENPVLRKPKGGGERPTRKSQTNVRERGDESLIYDLKEFRLNIQGNKGDVHQKGRRYRNYWWRYVFIIEVRPRKRLVIRRYRRKSRKEEPIEFRSVNYAGFDEEKTLKSRVTNGVIERFMSSVSGPLVQWKKREWDYTSYNIEILDGLMESLDK